MLENVENRLRQNKIFLKNLHNRMLTTENNLKNQNSHFLHYMRGISR